MFVDPFLLFESENPEYQKLHHDILNYVAFLRDISLNKDIDMGFLKNWFIFSEVKQNWFGYSLVGNGGSGLGIDFAHALKRNLNKVFSNFGSESITKSSHLEKLCIIRSGVGRDNISDFTVNLIKNFLCNYTQHFAQKYIISNKRRIFSVDRAEFDYTTKRWKPKKYELPCLNNDFVLLTPKDILTKDENWINSKDIIRNFTEIANSIPNEQLRASINFYFSQNLPKKTKYIQRITQKERAEAINKVIIEYPEFIDYYIRYKEDHGEKAKSISQEKVKFVEDVFIGNVTTLINQLGNSSGFYLQPSDTYHDSLKRVSFLKQVIENNDGYKIFYIKGKPIKREKDLQIMFRLTWFASNVDVNSEVDNGRGPVDYKLSVGSKDKTLVEFKLASNTKLKQNLKNQVEIYKKANQTNKDIKVILFFTSQEERKVYKILNELSLQNKENIILIDARKNNKISASNVK